MSRGNWTKLRSKNRRGPEKRPAHLNSVTGSLLFLCLTSWSLFGLLRSCGWLCLSRSFCLGFRCSFLGWSLFRCWLGRRGFLRCRSFLGRSLLRCWLASRGFFGSWLWCSCSSRCWRSWLRSRRFCLVCFCNHIGQASNECGLFRFRKSFKDGFVCFLNSWQSFLVGLFTFSHQRDNFRALVSFRSNPLDKARALHPSDHVCKRRAVDTGCVDKIGLADAVIAGQSSKDGELTKRDASGAQCSGGFICSNLLSTVQQVARRFFEIVGHDSVSFCIQLGVGRDRKSGYWSIKFPTCVRINMYPNILERLKLR